MPSIASERVFQTGERFTDQPRPASAGSTGSAIAGRA